VAFEWDHIQTRWLERRLGPLSRQVQSKVEVAGSQLEIDLVVEQPAPEAFFDFLGQLTLIENKAPGQSFSRAHLCRCAARTLLYVERRGLALRALKEITQLLLCARASVEVLRELPWRSLRPGILESRFVTRLVLVEANRLPVEASTLELLTHYASGKKLRETIQYVVDHEVHPLYTALWFLHRRQFKEILRMKGKSSRALDIDIRGAVEELGLKRVVEEVGLKRVVEEVGLKRVVEEVGLKRVVEEVGLEALIREVGADRVKEALRQVESTPEPRRRRKIARKH
jgi:hypothetical protein